jgi:DNA-binding transcriptional regulator YiaG
MPTPDPNPSAIKATREALGTQREMASRCEVSLRSWQRWEAGQDRPSGPARLLLAQLAAEAEAIRARKSG